MIAGRAGTILLAVSFAAGAVASSASQGERHALELNGEDWARLGPKEKQSYLGGFIAGAAAEQVRARALAESSAEDSISVSSRAINALRAKRMLQFRFAPAVYAAQIDDFYWWKNHADRPLVDVMISINGGMLKQQGGARP